MTDELWKARFAVKRAVLDVVAFEFHDQQTASDAAHADYLGDCLDEALEEYVEAFLAAKKARERRDSIPTAKQAQEMMTAYLNPHMP